MRNLKRALSLGLTAAMISGLMVMGSSAASYADVTSENNQEAIDVLQTVGIMVGDENGNFNPDQNVTRNEMAVIMANLMEYNVATYKDTSPFTDVPSWAEPYVAACYTNGITSGYSDTIYGGSDTVTTAQAALMLMKALGYFQYASDFGSDWQLATTRQGNAIDLFVGVDSGVTAPMTRDDVAQLVLNTLEAGTVQAETNGSWTIGDVTIVNGVKYNYVTSNQPYATAIDDSRTTNNDGDLVSGAIVELGEQLYMGDLKLNDNTSDDFMRPSRTWSYDGAEIGTYMKDELIVATYTEGVTGRELYDLLTSSTIREYGFEAYLNGSQKTQDSRDVIEKGDLSRSNNDDLAQTGNGVLTQVFLDLDNKEITITSIETWLAKSNSAYNSNSETLSVRVYDQDTDGSDGDTQVLDLADVPEIEGVAADQYLLVNQTLKDRDEYEIVAISEPEILEGADVTAFSTGKDSDRDDSLFDSLTADGTDYDASEQAHYNEDVLNLYDHDLLTDMTYNVYLDPYGYAIGVELYEGSLNYVFITGYDRNGSHISVRTADAAAIFTDGTMDVITVNVTNTNKNLDRNDDGDVDADYIKKYDLWTAAGDGESQVNRWFTYTENNGVYTLKPVDADEMLVTDYPTATNADPKVINCSNVWVEDNANNAGTGTNLTTESRRGYGNDDSVYITVEPGDVDYQDLPNDAITDVTGVYTGVQNVDIELSPDSKLNVPQYMYTLVDDDQYIIASVVLGEAQGSVENYAVILDAPTGERIDRTDNTYYWTFDAIMGGEKVELTAKSKYQDVIIDLQTAAATDAVMELRFDADEYVTGAEPVSADKIATFAITTGMEDYEVFDQEIDGNTITLEMDGRTMQIRDGSGLTFVNNAPTVLWQQVNNKGVYTAYSNVQEAYSDLADANTSNSYPNLQFNGRIVAVLNSQGVAEWAYIRSDTPVNGNGESFTDDGSATTLPSTTDLIVRDAGGVGSTSVAGRYDADAQKLYLQFSGLTADSALVDFANIQISDSYGSGKVINLDDVKVIKGTTTSYVVVVDYAATTLPSGVIGFNQINVSVPAGTVDSWYVKFQGTAASAISGPEIVKANDTTTVYTWTVKMPENVTSYSITDAGSSGLSAVDGLTTIQSGLTQDAVIKNTLTAVGSAPVLGVSWAGNVVTLTGEQPARSAIGAGVTSAYFTTPTSTTGTLNLTVVTSGNVATDGTNRIVVNYTENGVAKSVTKDTGLVGSGTETVTITVPSIAEDTTIVVTGVKVQAKVSVSENTFDAATTTNLTADASATYNGKNEAGIEADWLDVGSTVNVVVTIPGVTTGNSVDVTIGGGSAQNLTAAGTATGTYTVGIGANTLAVTVANG